jgi:hypothetical protein
LLLRLLFRLFTISVVTLTTHLHLVPRSGTVKLYLHSKYASVAEYLIAYLIIEITSPLPLPDVTN